MKKLKDLFYDYNDVIIAFAILLIAALLIIWRLDVILDYPDKILNNEPPQVETPVVDEDDKEDDADKDSEADKDDSADADATDQLWVDGKLSKEVKVKVKGDSASAAVQCLVDAELFENYADYQSVCTDMGINHENVSAGTFTFKAGSTKKDIVDTVNWS